MKEEKMRAPFRLLLVTAALLVMATLFAAPAAAAKPTDGSGHFNPVIFVHGGSGSAQQFETNAQRLSSNGYPHDRLFAYEYDTSTSGPESLATAVANLDPFVADVKAKTGASQVDILAHSRGTTVMHEWLGTPARAANVRRYVNFDGRTSDSPPGGVPTLAVWGEGDQTREIGGATNVYFPNKAHTEVTTSAEAFAEVYEFLNGEQPKTTRVLPEPPGKVTVAGRALIFPNNTGREGARVEIYRIDPATGARISNTPRHAVTVGADGSFGPLKVNGRHHYEFAVVEVGERTGHYYPEPFERSDRFVRLLNAPALAPFIDSGPNHTVGAVTRMREWWGDQASPSDTDRLEINGLNVINPAIAPRMRRVIAVFVLDRNSDGVTDTSTSLFPFNALSFLTGVDIFMPASSDASGTISFTETVRGAGGHTETINIPNWPSDQHTVSVYFKDYVATAFP
jgi:Lipase C-terminal domain/Lipase (class 2)